MLYGILFLFLILIIGVLFLKLSPEFGGSLTKSDQEFYASKTTLYQDKKFRNTIQTPMDMSGGDFASTLFDFIKGNPNREPRHPIPLEKIDSLEIAQKSSDSTKITWFGHSAFLLEIAGKNILIDPMFGENPSPLPNFSNKRYSKELPIAIAKIPTIDAVLISHDHYDHLDYGSIVKLKDKVGEFYVPLGVGAHLLAWGVDKSAIHELNWWESIHHEALTFICTPARHFSGRGLFDRFDTLWASWVIQGSDTNIFFSGDSGYGPHFKEIGDRYGPFDFAMMECGQYNERWENIHMMPEFTAQAFLDVQGGILMPIHWGAFTLALHAWKDPIDRVTKKAVTMDINITTPKIGETIILGQPFPKERWWDNLE